MAGSLTCSQWHCTHPGCVVGLWSLPQGGGGGASALSGTVSSTDIIAILSLSIIFSPGYLPNDSIPCWNRSREALEVPMLLDDVCFT